MTPVWASATLGVCIYHPAMLLLSCQLRTPFSPPAGRVNHGDGVGQCGQGSHWPLAHFRVCAELPCPLRGAHFQDRGSLCLV